MGAEREGNDWVWTGNVRDLVSFVADQDARIGFVKDKTSGAKIAINISGTDEPADEPFYIESPDGENMYDAYDRKEAVRMLNNIRAGRDADDYPLPPTRQKTARRRKPRKSRSSTSTQLRSMR